MNLVIGGKLISVYTYIFQCRQCNHSKVDLDTPKLTWGVLIIERYILMTHLD